MKDLKWNPTGQFILYNEMLLIQPKYRSFSNRRVLVKWLDKHSAVFVLVSLLLLLAKFAAEALAQYLLKMS